MPKLLEFESESGPVLVQVAPAAGELTPVGKSGEVIDRIARSMEDVLGVVAGVARSFSAAIAAAPVESAELEFALQFTAKGNLYVVETEAQGAIRVKLEVRPSWAGAARRDPAAGD